MERAQTAVRRALSEGAEPRGDAKRRAFAPITLGNRTIDVMNAEAAQLHPLVQAVTWAEEDKLNGLIWEQDHGSWEDGLNLRPLTLKPWRQPTGYGLLVVPTMRR